MSISTFSCPLYQLRIEPLSAVTIEKGKLGKSKLPFVPASSSFMMNGPALF